MSETWVGMAVGASALVIALPLVLAHYRRERRRTQLLSHLDHHDWWYRGRPRDHWISDK
ncbi:hypothetical protein BGLT_01818 [Caballeronia glathei]|uniref:hypothetical protein n=1 Tax=Caballeronia glathei TaxID=60547 RepID=UPI000501643D|nr:MULTISPECIES: hypothetical protein [Burkholderiaceae]TCK43535.1 hypothetical protein B0G84_1872 [Paraburkholderia sp. BL8N3]CDY79124.1 hypothetical protein BGLT_01818 [Caballeronia glathei]